MKLMPDEYIDNTVISGFSCACMNTRYCKVEEVLRCIIPVVL